MTTMARATGRDTAKRPTGNAERPTLNSNRWTSARLPIHSLTIHRWKLRLRPSPRWIGVGAGVPLFFVCGLDAFMNAEFIAMLDYLERERGIKREILLEAVSNALLSASKKSVSISRDLRIDINPKTGEIRALAKPLVVETVANPADEITLNKARAIRPDAQVGEEVEVEVTPRNFGRIAAQTAKQAMM